MADGWLFWICTLLCLVPSAFAANAAYKKHAEAKVTCGRIPEKYYNVSMRNLIPRFRVISTCDQSKPELAHNASNLVDGLDWTWWQSTAALNRANITIDMEGPNRKFYYTHKIVIRFGEYYRPKRMAFFKSTDFGTTYQPWHYYVTPGNNPTVSQQCEDVFTVPEKRIPTSADDVLCTEYPEEIAQEKDQEVILNFDANFRGSSLENPNPKFLDFINVTNVRIEFYALVPVFDLIAVRWHHYAVREVEVDAYCDCNGQGDGIKCTYNETLNDNQCQCQTGACDFNCQKCCPAYNQFPWKQGQKGPLIADKDAACQPCNCHDHSSVCVYNKTVAKLNMSMNMEGKYIGGGVCQNCQDNTRGINCEECKRFFFRPQGRSQAAKDACEACNCSIVGTKNITLPGVLYLDCVRDENTTAPRPGMGPGDCVCKNNTSGRRCDRCKPGFFNMSSDNHEGCQECTCNTNGTVNASNICTANAIGQCPCKRNVEGLLCTTCMDTFYDLQDSDKDGCKACDCDIGGSKGPVCNKTSGQCPCVPNVSSRRCKSPKDEYFFPSLHFMGSSEGAVTVHEGNSTWVTQFDLVPVANSSGLFILLLTYSSTSRLSVTITVTSGGTSTTQLVTLDSCSLTCTANLTEFGEITLSGQVKVNVTYPASATHFEPQRAVALPKEFYHPTLLGNATMAEFLANCSVIENDMGNISEECLAHVFSVTVGYLGGAQACECNPIGSVNFTCQTFGGQCHCKPGVTGRQCDQCQAEFYNFTTSGCSACDCKGDHKVCDVTTGQCECPGNTVGRMCDRCNHTYWGWNSTVGCQACNCNMTGSSDPQCNLTTGVCSCKDGVMGDKCTVCRDEYKNFSSAGCSPCGCDVNGSLSAVCDKRSGQCPCKNNTADLTCDRCLFGFFYLRESNAEGCTSCTCMGITKNCSSTSKFSFQKYMHLALWDLESRDSSQRIPVKPVSIENLDMISANISANQTLYWSANNNATRQSMVGAYGGQISLKLHISKQNNGSLVTEAKVILKGVKNITIEHTFPVVTPGQLVERQIDMKESSWVHAGSSRVVSREDFMLVLAKLQAFLITASFYESGAVYMTSLGNIKMSMVRDSPASDVAYDVEQCECGPGYTGLSCERCARGYHRVNVSGDPFLGKCVPCNCNGHSGDCNPDTGECLDCQHNSTGFHCQLCMDGFYGDATIGTPSDCKTCPCDAPRTTTSLCKADVNGRPMCLNCSSGYDGRICGSCSLGFFGSPLSPGGMCGPCQCNNNSAICNTISGECIDCKHNSTGFRCERCENGTWGNATLQQCQACSCDAIGAHHNVCNHVTGECECKPNVNGMNCSQCEVNSYNFTSSGCTQCLCNRFGSSKLQCNESGVCECRNHTLGKKCDLCEWGWFGLPYKTCEACDCNMTGSLNFTRCNRTSGECRCKPGVTARRCDQCMIQHTNFSDSGCDACPNCTRMGLQEDINKAKKIMEAAMDDAETVSNLKELWSPLEELEKDVRKAEISYQEFDTLVTSLASNISHLMEKAPNETVADLKTQLTGLKLQTAELISNMTAERKRVMAIHDNSANSSQLVSDLDVTVDGLVYDLGTLKNLADKMMKQAETFLNEDYATELSFSENELAKAFAVHSTALRALWNVSAQQNTTDLLNASARGSEGDLRAVEEDFSGIRGQVDAVTNYTLHVLVLLNHTKELITDGNATLSRAREALLVIARILTESRQNVADGEQALTRTREVLKGNPGLESQNRRLEEDLADVKRAMDGANQTVKTKATDHAANLTAEARKRQALYNSTLSHGGLAVSAIKKYREVVALMEQSLESSSKANETINQAMKRLENVTNVKSDLSARVITDLGKSNSILEATRQRDVHLDYLRANVSFANETFWRAVGMGEHVEQQHSILLSTRDSLELVAERGAANHSIECTARKADYWSTAEANTRYEPVINQNATVRDRIEKVSTQISYINMAAGKSQELMPEAFSFVRNASKDVGDVKNKVNQADRLRSEIESLQADLERNVTALEEKLGKIKSYAAKIRLALNVKGSTSVEYEPPARIYRVPRLFNEISVDFNPTRAQGTLFFMSGDKGTSLSLSISSEAYVEFKYNLSDFHVSLTNWEVGIRPGSWYRAYATRFEKTSRLTVYDYSANRSRTYDLSDHGRVYRTTEMMFTNISQLFLGGLPSGASMHDSSGYFDGCIDNVLIDQEYLNLWEPASRNLSEPASVDGNRSFCTRRPPLSREGLYPLVEATSFYGTGFIEQRMADFNVANHSELAFQFRTFQDVGLLASVSQGQEHFYGVYLNMSRVVFFLKASGQTHKVHSQQASYSDGRWHQVRVIRRLDNITLTVTTVGAQIGPDVSTVALGGAVRLSAGGSLFFGGVNRSSPGNVPVSSPFAGCMRNVSLSSPTSLTLVPRLLSNKNLTLNEAVGVDFNGCLKEAEEGIRFLGDSYAVLNNTHDVLTSLKITFKTLTPSGLLFYSSENPFLYLALFHGNLLLVSTNSTNRETIKISQTETTDTETLNDGAYHTVEVTYGPTSLRMKLDGGVPQQLDLPSGPVSLSQSLFVGGLEPLVTIPLAVPVFRPFVGAMKEIVLNGIPQEIFSGSSQRVSLAGVPPELNVRPTAQPTERPEPPKCGDSFPALENSTNGELNFDTDGNYVGFKPTAEVLDYIDKKGVISVRFRALSPNGVLLYCTDDVLNPTHFLSLELVNGALVYKFDAGAGLIRIQSNYNNYSSGGHWWTVRLLRIYQFGAMLISETKDYKKSGDENSLRPILNINSPIYYGGIPQNASVNASFLESGGLTFLGCLGDLTIQSSNRTKNLSPRNDSDVQTSQFSKKPCYKDVQAQAGFDGSGQLPVSDKFNLPTSFVIALKFRTTERSGLLMVLTNGSSVRAPSSVVLEKVQGQVALTFNGDRNSTVVWTDPLLPENSAKNASFRLCDNNFHEVLLHKEGDQVTLSVDGHNVTYGAVQQNFFLVDGKFFIGGYPDDSGIQGYGGMSRTRLKGCVESLRIGDKFMDLIRMAQMPEGVQPGCRAPRKTISA